MKILLTGASGQVGFELRRSLAVLGDCLALSSVECDLRDAEAVRKVVRAYAPNVIVNPAAYTAVDKAETEAQQAMLINAQAPGILAEEARRIGAFLLHFSTDYVFDGRQTQAYSEEDLPNPQSVYGASKWAGEQAVQAYCPHHLILRTSWVVGVHGGNFAKTMLRLASERDTLNVVADQFGAPTSAALLADLSAHLIRQAAQQPQDFPYGLYHATASGETSWYAYACYVIERARAVGKPLRLALDALKPILATAYPLPAQRPANSRLNNQKLQKTFGLYLPPWQVGLDYILEQIFEQNDE